jgi:hypothetical protein
MGFNQQKWEWDSVKIGVICWVNIMIFYKYVETILKQLYSYIMLYNVIYLDITHIYIYRERLQIELEPANLHSWTFVSKSRERVRPVHTPTSVA